MKKIYNNNKPKIDKKCFNGLIHVNGETFSKTFIWSYTLNKWVTPDDEWKLSKRVNNSNYYFFKGKVSVRQALKFLRKHKHYLPKGTTFRLCDIDDYDNKSILIKL